MPDRLPILDSSPLQEPEAVVDHALEESAEELADETYGGRVDPSRGMLRVQAARGTLVNAAYLISVNALGLVRGFLVAAFITASDYGLWGILLASLGTLAWLKQVGIDDKYVQQDESDQQAAFQKAFTLEAIFSGGLWLLLLVSVPVIALVYGEWRLLAPGLLLTLMVPAVMLQSPLWIFYRQLDFARQRKLQAIEPLVAFAVTIGLAVAGAGYWSLLIGALAGAWTSALAALCACPYRLRFRYESGTMRSYARFSWPLFASGLSAVVLVQGSMLVGTRVLGLAAVGIISLATTISLYSTRVDDIVTQTLYPVVCAVKERRDLLLETFVKTNRLAIMWGLPFGVGVALFAHDLVTRGLGHRWAGGAGLIAAYGLIAGVNQIGFNWHAFYRARGETRPVAVVNVAATVTFCCVGVPLMFTDGLTGFAIGMGATTAVALIGRSIYLARLFPALRIQRHFARAIAPTLPPLAAVLGMRALLPGDRSPGRIALELAVYLLVTAAATFLLERPLLRELAGYARQARLRTPSPSLAR